MLCDYGCGSEGLFVTSSGKNCCNKNYAGCPAIKKKNANGVSKSWASGKKTMPDDYVPHNKGTINTNPKADFCLNGKGNHKRVLITERGHRCESCKNIEWLDEPIPLELEHIDGNNKNNVKENLQLLCPNCHAKTSTYRGRNIKKKLVISDNELISALQSSETIRQALEKVGLVGKGGNYSRCKKLLSGGLSLRKKEIIKKKNSQDDTLWICHLDKKENKKITSIELDSYLKEGWISGRVMKF